MAYTNILDMFDGGGMGRSGDKFQGGGLLSQLGNMVAKPIGYNTRQRNRRTIMNSTLPFSMGERVGNNFNPLKRPDFSEMASMSELDNISFTEFVAEASRMIKEKTGQEPTFEQMMTAYMNYLQRP